MKKIKLLSILVLFSFTIANFTQCKKDKENTCNNGVKDGDEQGVDCGGEDCDSCADVYKCQGTPEDSFLPYNTISDYNYTTETVSNGLLLTSASYTFKGTSTIDGNIYQKIRISSSGPTTYKYSRINSDGELFEYDTDNLAEYLVVSDVKDVGYSWNKNSYTYKINSKNATFTSPSGCEYTDLIEVYKINSSGSLRRRYYYKKGLGLVGEKFSILNQYVKYISNLTLNSN